MEPTTFLASLRLRLRRVIITDALARALRLLIACFVVFAILDFSAALPAFLRLFVTLAVVAAVIYGLQIRLFKPLRRGMGDRALAQLVERRSSDLNGLLLSYVDGLRLDERDLQLLQERLPAHLLQRMVQGDGAARRGLGAGLLVVVVAVISATNPQLASTALQRFVLPFGAAEWPRSTVHTAAFERNVVAEDEPLIIAIDRPQGPSGALRLSWQNDRGGRDSDVLPALRGPWRELLNLDRASYEFEISGVDALPIALQAHVVARPVAVLEEVKVTPPAYTKRPVQRLQSLSGAVLLPGTQLEATFILKRSELRRDDTTVLRFADTELTQWTADEHGLTFTLSVEEEGELSLHLVDIYDGLRDGVASPIEIANRPSTRIPLEVVADAIPQVVLSGPKAGETISPQAVLRLGIQAQDDIGLAGLSLRGGVTTPSEEAGQNPELGDAEVEYHAFDDVADLLTTEREHLFPVASLVAVGDRLHLVSQAQDGNVLSGPGIGRSSMLKLRVVHIDELQQELDQQLIEVRDRLLQSRESLSKGLSDAAELTDSSRAASAIARRGAERLDDVMRRWQDNQLDAERQGKLQEAQDKIRQEALNALTTAGVSSEQEGMPFAQEADAALRDAAKILTNILQSDDLLRVLDNMIRRQEQVNEQSRSLVLQALVAPLSGAARTAADQMAEQQAELAKELRDVERSLLDSTHETHKQAQSIVEQEQPADLLSRAADGLSESRPSQQNVRQQNKALDAMREMRNALRGQDAAGELADDISQLAKRQDAINEALAAGEKPADLAPDQEAIRQRAEELNKRLDELSTPNQAASEAMQGAEDSAQAAEDALENNRSSSAAREGASAASQMRAAAQALGGDGAGEQDQGDEQDQANQEEEDDKPDVIALLRELVVEQSAVVTKASILHKSEQERFAAANPHGGSYNELSWPSQRELAAIADKQDSIALRLVKEGVEELSQQPIAARALQRVLDAVTAAHAHFTEPALGDRGIRLPKIALFEMQRLLAIAENMPTPPQGGEGGQGEGEGGGQQDTPPFPPAAELAFVRAEQERIAWQTRTRQPGDLASEQGEVGELLEYLLQTVRPGSRGQVLLERSQRAMLSAHQRLDDTNDRGSLTQTEQDVALASLTQLLREAQESSSSSSSSQQSSSSSSSSGQSSSPSSADGPGQGNNSGSSSASAQSSARGEGTDGKVVVETGQPEDGEFLRYAPSVRPRLIEAMNDPSLPPEARVLLRRYFELLER